MTELTAASPTPGIAWSLTTVAAEIKVGDTTIKTNAAAPTNLRGGSFRIVLDSEYMSVTGGQDGTTWAVERGLDGSAEAVHAVGAKVTHVFTPGAFSNLFGGFHPMDAAGSIAIGSTLPAITGTDLAVLSTITANSKVVKVANTAGLQVGYVLSGAFIKSGTSITAIPKTGVNGEIEVSYAIEAGAGSGKVESITYEVGRNVAYGSGALQSVTTGAFNVALGTAALASNTTASGNVAMGYAALELNKTGIGNVATGFQALEVSTSNYNTAVGWEALWENTTGEANAAFGYRAAWSLKGIKGAFVTALGTEAAYSMTGNAPGGASYIGVTAVGYRSLWSGTVNEETTMVGVEAGYGITSGAKNTGVGHQVFWKLKNGFEEPIGLTGNRNVAIGNNTLYSLVGASSDNTAVGASGLSVLLEGNKNTVVGAGAGSTWAEGSGNTAIGYEAGFNIPHENTLAISAGTTTPFRPLIYGQGPNNFLQFEVKELGLYKHAATPQAPTLKAETEEKATLVTMASTASLKAGMSVAGEKVKAGTTITEVKSATELVLSNAIEGAGTAKHEPFLSFTGMVSGFTVAKAGNTAAEIKEDFEKSTFTGGIGSTAYTISDVVRALKLMGALKE